MFNLPFENNGIKEKYWKLYSRIFIIKNIKKENHNFKNKIKNLIEIYRNQI